MTSLERLGLLIDCSCGKDLKHCDVAFSFGILSLGFLMDELRAEDHKFELLNEVVMFGRAFYIPIGHDSGLLQVRILEGLRLFKKISGDHPKLIEWRDGVRILVIGYVYSAVKNVGIPHERCEHALASHLEGLFSVATGGGAGG